MEHLSLLKISTITFSTESEIDISESTGMTSGDNVVFHLNMINEGDEGVVDDDLYGSLIFELPKSQEIFSVINNDLKRIKVHFQRACFCTGVEFKEVTSGCIRGEKLMNGNWSIQAWIDDPIGLKFDAEFVE